MVRPDGERIAAVETRLDAIEQKTDRIEKTLYQMRDILVQAKGVRWVIGATIAITGTVFAGLEVYIRLAGK